MPFCKIIILVIVTVLQNTNGFEPPNHHHHHPDNYGKPCSRTNPPDANLIHCDLDKNMYCSSKGFCECLVGERGRVFTHYQKRCIEVASPHNKFSCREDQECKLSSYGKSSRCNRDFDTCECHDENHKAVLKDDECFIEKLVSRSSAIRFQGCSSDGDCQGSSLGNLTRCNKVTNACECYDRIHGQRNVAPYKGICVYEKRLNELCQDHGECRVGYHKNALCERHPTYLANEKVCQCPEGYSCDDDGSGANVYSQSLVMVGVTTAVMGVLATKVLS